MAVHRSAFPTPAEADLVGRLRVAGRADISLVAEHRSRIVGHVLCSPVTLSANCAAGGGVGLAPLAVTPAMQRRRIGSWLVIECLAVCRRRGHRFVVVLGDPAFYGRFGFEPARTFGLAGDYGTGNYFMVSLLSAGALPPEGGHIHYAPEFAALQEDGPVS